MGLQFPRFGEFHINCEWLTVTAQGVPAHVGAEALDPYTSFLPTLPNSVAADLRAVVFVVKGVPSKALFAPPRSTRRPCWCSQVRSMRRSRFPISIIDFATLYETTVHVYLRKLCKLMAAQS